MLFNQIDAIIFTAMQQAQTWLWGREEMVVYNLSPQSALKSGRGVGVRVCALNPSYLAAGVEHMQGPKNQNKTKNKKKNNKKNPP